MKVYCDSSVNEACIVIEGEDPIIIPYKKPVTNNTGEYLAVIAALSTAFRSGAETVEVLTDSLLVVNQVSGDWECRKLHLLNYRDRVRHMLVFKFEYYAAVKWISREENPAGKVLEGM